MLRSVRVSCFYTFTKTYVLLFYQNRSISSIDFGCANQCFLDISSCIKTLHKYYNYTHHISVAQVWECIHAAFQYMYICDKAITLQLKIILACMTQIILFKGRQTFTFANDYLINKDCFFVFFCRLLW